MSLGWYATEDELRQEVEKALVWIECRHDGKTIKFDGPGCFVSYIAKSGEIRKGVISSYTCLGHLWEDCSFCLKSKQLGQPWSTEGKRRTFSSEFLDIALLEFSPAEVPWFETKGVLFLQIDGCAGFYRDKLCCCQINNPSRKSNETVNFSDGQVVAVAQPWILHDCDLTVGSNGSPLLKLAHKNDQCTYQLVGIIHHSRFNTILSWGTSTEAIINAINADREDVPIEYPSSPSDPIPSDDELICMLFGVDMAAAKDLDPSISEVTLGFRRYSDDVFYTLECDKGVKISVKPTKWLNLFTLMYARDSRFKFVPWRKFSVEEFKGFYKLAAALLQNQGSEWLKAVENYLRDSRMADLADFFSPDQIIDTVDNIKWLVTTKDGPRKLAQAVIETNELPQQKEQIRAKLEQFDSGAITEVCLVEAIADFLERCHQHAQFQSRLLTDFEPIKSLGSGAFGVVYKCRKKIEALKLYAVKQICIPNSEKRGKILQEVLTLIQLSHDGVVRYYHAWEEEPPVGWTFPGAVGNSDSCSSVAQSSLSPSSFSNLPSSNSMASSNSTYLYIQMELCDTSLYDWLDDHRNDKTRDTKAVRSWLEQLSCAMEHVHKKEIIHRDLKPANIFISDGRLKIGDFGLATFEESVDTEGQEALINGPVHTAYVGTYIYMAPEQRKHEQYSYPVDVFSLGLIFVELLIPIGTDHERLETFQLIRNGALPEKLAQMPDLGDLVKSMTLESPEERVKVNDVVSMLQKLKSEVEINL